MNKKGFTSIELIIVITIIVIFVAVFIPNFIAWKQKHAKDTDTKPQMMRTIDPSCDVVCVEGHKFIKCKDSIAQIFARVYDSSLPIKCE